MCNPPEQWVLRRNVFPAIVSQEVFERTQAKLGNLVNRRSNEQLLEELRGLLKSQGTLNPTSIGSTKGVAGVSTYRQRFGGLLQAYKLIEYQGGRYTLASLEEHRVTVRLKAEAMEQLKNALSAAKIRLFPGKPRLRLAKLGYFDLCIAKCLTTPRGHLRWKVRVIKTPPKYTSIVFRLQPGNAAIKDFVVLRSVPTVCRDFTLSDAMANNLGTICDSAAGIVSAISGPAYV